MSDASIWSLTILLVTGAFAAAPMLARSRRMLAVVATSTGLLAGSFWILALSAEWDKHRMIAGITAVILTTGWVIGSSGAILRLTGRKRGWRIADFPAAEALVTCAVLALALLWSTYFFGGVA